ncbi:MAG: 50S ribosomal protein L21 [Dictyoglomus sp.]|nr:50S ribosomal protein L21 [Dictyoglomus sp.]MCX7942017.1 50S ribosomal protein L21 [Dictyoglomaceae bacterium]MDW8188721.1 50S ribosomal protein L21 [Dictyoglomus sp.]
MFAVVETGGKQYKVSVGSIIEVEKINAKEGEEVILDKILLLNKDGEVLIGKPYLEGVKITAKVLKQDKYPKVIVFKFKRKKHYRRKYGHRQPFTRLAIQNIEIQ